MNENVKRKGKPMNSVQFKKYLLCLDASRRESEKLNILNTYDLFDT